MKKFATLMLLAALLSTAATAQVNMGDQKGSADLPFTMTKVADFDTQPWRIAFLPDGRLLVTEKDGHLWLITQAGQKTPVFGTPKVLYGGQGGFLGVYISPHYATDHYVYLTYSEPNEGGSSLAMARARLNIAGGNASLQGLQVLWHDPAGGLGGQFGAAIAFAPDGRSLFLSVGDRQRMTPAQDPNSPLGKILHLTLDGKAAAGNPGAGKPSGQSLPIINPPVDTEVAKTAPVVRTFTYPASAPNQTVAETWSSGHRTPYGLAFAPDGRLWELEHGPRGGDELNLIEKGKNYGWPEASYSTNYNGVAIPSPDTRADLAKPVIYFTPVIAPGNLMFYKGNMFRGWQGSAFATGTATQSLTRITFDGKGGATAVERFNVGMPVRDLAVAPDGALWLAHGALNNSIKGSLYRLTPK